MDPPCSSQSLYHLSHQKGSSQRLRRGQSRGHPSSAQALHTVSFLDFAYADGLSEENNSIAHEDELFIELQPHGDLINPPFDFSVQDEADEQLFHLVLVHIELLCQERQLKPCVWLDQVDEVLRPQTAEQFPDIQPNERIIHDCGSVFCKSLSAGRDFRRNQGPTS